MGADLEAPLLAKAEEPFQAHGTPPPAVKRSPLAWFLWALDFLLWVLTIVGPVKWICSRCKSQVNGVQGDDGCIRYVSCPELLTRPRESCNTVYEIMQRSSQIYAANNAFGTRRYLGTHTPEGARFPLAKFGDTQWTTYAEAGQRAHAFGAGLRASGLLPQTPGADLQDSDGPHTILLFEDTSAPWLTAMLGAFTQSVAVATSYSTLGLNAVAASVYETSAKAVVCNVKDVEKVAKACSREACPSLGTIIYTTNNSTDTAPKSTVGSHMVLSIEEVIAQGHAALAKFVATPPTPDTLGVIMYTSGSTGKPKGVMIKHSALAASIAGVRHKFMEFSLMEGKETYLAYLPAAHIFELVVELSCLELGAAIGYADPRTIAAKGACRERPDGTLNTRPEYPYPPGAIQEFRPTVMVAVPKIWDILKKGVEDTVGRGSASKKFLFQVAFSARYWAVNQGRESPLFRKLVFSKLANILGGRLKVGISGGGPLSADVQNFIRVAFAMPLLQGYALTESTCAGTLQRVEDCRNGIVGPPLPSVELRLRTCINEKGEPEILDREMKPYTQADTMHYCMPCLGRGEVLIRGPSVSSGYFKQPEKTAEVYTDGGWFHSGDVGVFLPDGALMLVDRVKNLVKLKGGEYIAVEAMEKEYSTCVYVNPIAGGLLCYGDGEMDRPVALVQANVPELEKWAKGQGIAYESAEQLCSQPAARKFVLDCMVKIGKEAGLGANEILCALALIPGTGPVAGDLTATSPWTPENSGLTASNKLNRQQVLKGCASLLGPLKTAAIK